MRGNLHEIDIASIFELVELGQLTGSLYVENSSVSSNDYFSLEKRILTPKEILQPKSHTWLVFFENGEIIYTLDSHSGMPRLEDHLFHYRISEKLDSGEWDYQNTCIGIEYAYLWKCLEKKILKPQQARDIIRISVYETLFDLFTLHEGHFFFEMNTLLSRYLIETGKLSELHLWHQSVPITAVKFSSIKSDLLKHLQSWKSMYPHVVSPEQSLILTKIDKLYAKLPLATVKKLQYWSEEKTSLRRLARFISKGTCSVAKAMYPYILEGSVKLVHYNTLTSTINLSSTQKGSSKYIACIYSPSESTYSELLFSVLREENLKAIAIENSWEALGQIFKLQPGLIICDANMPILNGYEICNMLRNSRKFSTLPIIMLSNKDEEFSSVKAKAYGATDFLEKPFSKIELKSKISKYMDKVNLLEQQKLHIPC